MLRVAIVFTIGCSVLVCNAVLSTLPLITRLKVQLPEACIYVEGILSVLSCALFLVGSFFAFIEAWTLDDTSSPGLCSRMQGVSAEPAIEKEDDSSEQTTETESEKEVGEQDSTVDHSDHDFHTISRNDSAVDLLKVQNTSSTNADSEKADGEKQCDLPCKPDDETTTAKSSRTRYLELGIFASTIFLCSSALYCATSIVSLVTIIQSGRILRCIRYPQLVAASGFAIASSMLIIKTQRDSHDRWWRLPIFSLSFAVNTWNLVGSLGFIFCAYFGLLEHAFWAQKQFGYSYLWGSWAFLFGSVMSWYQSMHRKDVSVDVWKAEKSPA